MPVFFVSGDGHIGKETSEGKQKHLSYAAGSTETAEQCRKLGTARYFRREYKFRTDETHEGQQCQQMR